MKLSILNPLATNLAPVLLIIASASLYFWYLGTFAVNIPQGDDILDALKFVSAVVREDDWNIILKHFFIQHNEHRTGASRLIYYAAYLVQGEINFRILVLVANLALPLLLLLFYIRVRHQQYRWLILLPVALLLFQLRNYNLVVWTMAAFAFFCVFLYGFCCIYALHRVTPGKFILAIVFAILATFSLASGQIIWLAGLASLLHQSLIDKSISMRYAIFWFLITVLVLSVWRWEFVVGTIDIKLVKAFFPGNTIDAPILVSILHRIHFFLSLLGSAVSNSSTVATSLSGAICLAVLAVVSATSYRKSDLRVELCCWYVVLSTAAIAWGRAQFFPIDYAMNPRYGFPSTMMLCLIWVLLALRVRKHQLPVLVLAVLAAVFYSVNSYRTYPVLFKSSLNRVIDDFNHDKYMSIVGNMRGAVRNAASLGVYKPPLRPLPLYKVNDETDSSK